MPTAELTEPITGDPVTPPPAAVVPPPVVPDPPPVAAVVPPAQSEPPAVVPETYAVTVPDGAEAFLDAADLALIVEQAKAQSLTTVQTQAAVQAHADALAAQSVAFRTALEADRDFGGDKLIETQRLSAKALDTIWPSGTPNGDAMRRLLRTGYGNHLAIVSGLATMGKLLSEDRPTATGGGGAQAERPPTADVLYAKTTSAKK